ncbi:hypothetical protein PAXRUDRAFT_621332 [Paxillus rubicundulus Ve08.2h10]|uniref:Uncharacterized protein n=1 Tax=Paxillus rubicundulus Ve08.2h10 TaxID=930991 RepID=A0A0D0BMX8_9AGAM|nr:hypothetical protein PAXRUDRAFT_621332 [Paxillus rubicundulus Ve08.2h10]
MKPGVLERRRSQANLSFTFGSDTCPVNPMELTTPVTITDNGKQYTRHMNAECPPGPIHHPFTWPELKRCLHSFNHGNSTKSGGDPKNDSIQLLSRTDRDQDYQDFAGSRKQSLKSYPALTDLTKLKCDGTTSDGGHVWALSHSRVCQRVAAYVRVVSQVLHLYNIPQPFLIRASREGLILRS